VERFGLLYKYAKYITTGNSNHRRSQLYTDACHGKLDANELLTEIREKRNQEKLRAYPLIPFGADPAGEALSRYEFNRGFEKEPKQFGAQRRASEAMCDIDLVISVAHVGGVDPETSHSSIELRIAIAKELLALMSINNVTFAGAHAKIQGSLGEYSVHMGSGVVHQLGVGMLAVLPVHSQHRGRLFLPFADSDPKTAEIMSKLILFAEDKKIKDLSILMQINR
jgi:hypothetical protein